MIYSLCLPARKVSFLSPESSEVRLPSMEKIHASITISSTASFFQFSQSNVDLKPALSNTSPRVLKPSEYKAAALCLAEAFATDEVAQYIIETGDRPHWSAAEKWDLHVTVLEYIVYAHCLKGLAMTVGPNYDAVALW